MDLCFELARQIMVRLAGRVDRGRRDARASSTSTSATCSASSTAPRTRPGRRAHAAALVGDEDPDFAGGSYVIVQKYLHDLAAWNALAGRGAGAGHRPDQAGRHRDRRRRQAGQLARRAEHDRRRRRRPSGRSCATTCRSASAGAGEFGTYFIGYAGTPSVTEQMLANMFIGNPPGNHRPDPRLLHRRHRAACSSSRRPTSSTTCRRAAGAAGASSAAGDRQSR